MKVNKRASKELVFAVVLVVFFGGALLVLNVIFSHDSGTYYERAMETYNIIDQNTAITQLSERRGRILEVQSLCFKDIPQDILWDELKGITSPMDLTNPYLKDFTFEISDTSNLEEICDELISQIDNQIHTIEYGGKDA